MREVAVSRKIYLAPPNDTHISMKLHSPSPRSLIQTDRIASEESTTTDPSETFLLRLTVSSSRRDRTRSIRH